MALAAAWDGVRVIAPGGKVNFIQPPPAGEGRKGSPLFLSFPTLFLYVIIKFLKSLFPLRRYPNPGGRA
jgi:hypothetical protein